MLVLLLELVRLCTILESVAEIEERNEQRTLDEQIHTLSNCEYTVLPRSDRVLFEEKNVPKLNSTTAHKKCWVFNVTCAIDRQYYMVDHEKRTLYEYGFAITDPI